MAIVTLPDGTTVRASSLAERVADDPERDFGLYLDPGWRPDWPAELIAWPDFGLPAYPELAFHQIIEAYARAVIGQNVEVGCLGGRGRTGTVLACFAVLGGLGPADAIEWVRREYDARAVETEEQAQWVHWFAARIEEEEPAG